MPPDFRRLRARSLLRLSLGLIGASLLAPPRAALSAEIIERRLGAMGTILDLRVESVSRAAALEASETAAREIERIEDLLSTWKRGGPLDRLNTAPLKKTVSIGGEAAALLLQMRDWSLRTQGAFDPTVLPLIRAWDLRGRGRLASEEEIARARAALGWDGFDIEEQRGQARRLHADAGIDEGAWGKGYALDCAAAALRQAGASWAVLDLGGQVLAVGPATIAISDPRQRRRVAASVVVSNASVSTSGNSERGLIVGGRRVGHLLDPHTGYPAPDFGSATAIAPSGLVADVLSTAFFVLGPDKGLALSKRLRLRGFPNQALFLIVHGDCLKAVASEDLSFNLEEINP